MAREDRKRIRMRGIRARSAAKSSSPPRARERGLVGAAHACLPTDCEADEVRRLDLSGIEGVRWLPDAPTGVGALVVAGSSGRVDASRARVLADQGVLAESVRWFGGAGQHEGPWDIPLELFLGRVDRMLDECDRVVLVGTSFGAEAALLVGAWHPQVDTVVAFAPSDVAWAGLRPDGSVTSHWTLGGVAVPFVPFDDTWAPDADVPAYVELYRASRNRFPEAVAAAAIPVERIDTVVLVAGVRDEVWPAVEMARAIEARRLTHGRSSVMVVDPDAGHRAILPGEPVVRAGVRMRRGGDEHADRRIGEAAWAEIIRVL